MKHGPQIATAVAVGYALGRTRRMKLALMVGGVVLGRRMGDPRQLLEKAGASGEVGEMRDRLVEAARSAAVTAAGNKIDALGENLSDRAAKIRSPHSDSSGGAEEDEQQEEPDPTPKQRSSEGTRAPRKPSAPRAPRKRPAASKSGGGDG